MYSADIGAENGMPKDRGGRPKDGPTLWKLIRIESEKKKGVATRRFKALQLERVTYSVRCSINYYSHEHESHLVLCSRPSLWVLPLSFLVLSLCSLILTYLFCPLSFFHSPAFSLSCLYFFQHLQTSNTSWPCAPSHRVRSLHSHHLVASPTPLCLTYLPHFPPQRWTSSPCHGWSITKCEEGEGAEHEGSGRKVISRTIRWCQLSQAIARCARAWYTTSSSSFFYLSPHLTLTHLSFTMDACGARLSKSG